MRLVLEGDVGDLGGQREDNVEVTHGQQVGLALGEPCTRGSTLALGAQLLNGGRLRQLL